MNLFAMILFLQLLNRNINTKSDGRLFLLGLSLYCNLGADTITDSITGGV